MKGEIISIESARKLRSREKAIEYIKHKQFIKEQVLNKKDYSLNDREVKELLKILEGK